LTLHETCVKLTDFVFTLLAALVFASQSVASFQRLKTDITKTVK